MAITLEQVKNTRIDTLIDEITLQARVSELGEQISRDYAGQDLILICILRGFGISMSAVSLCLAANACASSRVSKYMRT